MSALAAGWDCNTWTVRREAAIYGVALGSVLAQQKFCTETITAEHHVNDTGSYTYTVRVEGGEHNGVEFHCRTAASTFWLFDLVVTARREHREWDWLSNFSRKRGESR